MANKTKQISNLSGYAIVSIAIILFLLEVYLLLSLHTSNLTDYFKEQVSFVVELSEGANQTQLSNLKAMINASEYVISERTEYIDKAAALQLMTKELDGAIIGEGKNPFKELIIFYLKADQFDDHNIATLEAQIKSKNGVDGFYYAKTLFDNILSNLKSVGYIMLAFMALLFILTLLIIFNTIRIKLDNDRFKIKTMELVGAEHKYINRIYQNDAFAIWIKATLLSILMLVLVFVVVYLKYPDLIKYLQMQWLIISVIIASLIGYIIMWLTTKLQLNRYISKHFYQLYH